MKTLIIEVTSKFLIESIPFSSEDFQKFVKKLQI